MIEILNKKVSYLDHFSSEVIKEETLGSILNQIKSKKLLVVTNALRALRSKGNLSDYNKNKKNLPAVTFCGFFSPKRSGDHLKEYNYLMVLDIDKLDENEVLRVKDVLVKDKYVFSFWESPSGNGIKGLVSLKYLFDIQKGNEDRAHKIAFKALDNYFTENYGVHIDASGCDITRLCFLSCDQALVLKEVICPFEVEADELALIDKTGAPSQQAASANAGIKDFLENPVGKNNSHFRKTIADIIKYLTAKQLSITHDYDSWYRVAFAIAESFTYSVGEKYYLALSRLDTGKFNEIKCKQMLQSCYVKSKHKIGFKTIIRLATEKGFTYKGLMRGVAKAAETSCMSLGNAKS